MRNTLKKIAYGILVVLIMITASASSGAGQEKSPQSDSSSVSWISNGKALGKWWMDRAKATDPLPPELLYHFEADYSFTESTGSYEESEHRATVSLTLRKGVFTNGITYKHNEKDYGPGRTKKEKYTLDESLFVELWEKTDILISGQWYSYNKDYMDSRYTASAGLYHTFLSSPAYTLKAGLLCGYAQESYMNDELLKDGLITSDETIPDYNTGLLFFIQRFTWSLSKNMTFSEKLNYRQYLKDTEYRHWTLNLDLNYSLTDNISVFSAYEIDYDSNQSDDLKGSSADDEDADLSVGIRISF